MPIDINGLNNSANPVATDRSNLPDNERAPLAKTDGNGPSSVEDTVSFSDAAVRLGRLGVAVDDTPVVDTQRVEEVKQALADGTYNVDATRIAEKLMALDTAFKGD